MSTWIRVVTLLAIVLLIPVAALATNGDNLIGVGPISRAMGGVGIAHPQDAISAVFSNPAAMCFGDFCPSSQVDFAGTVFLPTITGTAGAGTRNFDATSASRTYPIPALGISWNFPELPKWRFGFGAYGSTGLGVDYRATSLNTTFNQIMPFPPGFPRIPLVAGQRTELSIMKFAPTVAFVPLPWLSIGAALNIDYSTLDLGSGVGGAFGIGAQIGAIVKPHPQVSLGVTYTTPQNITYRRVTDFTGSGSLDDLTLGSPNILGFGIAVEPIVKKLLIEGNLKWLNWSNARGYKDFDWRDQVVLNIGAQYKPIPKLALRVGYNYGQNPVTPHRNFNGSATSFTNVQGFKVPTYYYESFRTIGFPAIVQHHFTCGIGYNVTDRFIVNLGYVHSFAQTLTENGTNLFGQPAKFRSTLYENAVDVGFSVRF
jgi:long-chain fatty acid transport protein